MSTPKPSWTAPPRYRDVIQRRPVARAGFPGSGVDARCGSVVDLEQAARRDNLDATTRCALLRAAAGAR